MLCQKQLLVQGFHQQIKKFSWKSWSTKSQQDQYCSMSFQTKKGEVMIPKTFFPESIQSHANLWDPFSIKMHLNVFFLKMCRKREPVKDIGLWKPLIKEADSWTGEETYVQYLSMKFLVLSLECIIFCFNCFELSLKEIIVFLQLLGLPPGPPVLEPYSNLSWLQTKGSSQLHFPLGLKLVTQLKILLKCFHLLHVQPPLLFSGLWAIIRQIILPICFFTHVNTWKRHGSLS